MKLWDRIKAALAPPPEPCRSPLPPISSLFATPLCFREDGWDAFTVLDARGAAVARFPPLGAPHGADHERQAQAFVRLVNDSAIAEAEIEAQDARAW